LPAGAHVRTAITAAGRRALLVAVRLSSLRLRLTDPREEKWLDLESDSLDEGAAHLSTALLTLSSTSPCWSKVPTSRHSNLEAVLPQASGPSGRSPLSSDLRLIFFMLVPRLYAAYVDMNKVREELSGSTGRAFVLAHIDRERS
jgi:hypothetical protein